MVRLSAIFVAICMVLIAGSCGALLYLWFGLSGAESAIVALATMTGLALHNTVSNRLRDRGDFSAHISDLSRGTADLARQVAELGRRVATIETNANTTLDKALAATKPLTAEIGELGVLLKQLAETVNAHDTALRAPPPAPPVPVAPSPPVAAVAASAVPHGAATTLPDPAKNGDAAISGPFNTMEHEAAIATIRDAINANRVDLYLQPIVTLPQRKVRFYEAMARLRSADGEVLIPADFLAHAETNGLMPRLDNMILFRCVQVLRRLVAKNRDVGLFCNISAMTLGDSDVLPAVQRVSSTPTGRWRRRWCSKSRKPPTARSGPIEIEAWGRCGTAGSASRWTMSAICGSSRAIWPNAGSASSRCPRRCCSSRAGPAASDIHPADFAGLLSRFGIEMMAEKIESESVVVDLLDYDVKYGQGFLFSPPRPVRPEVMQGIAERPSRCRRDVAEPPARRPPSARRRPARSQCCRPPR